MLDTIIISVAPNGAKKPKEDVPNIPLNAIEVALEAKNIVSEGASVIHLYVRDENDKHTLEPSIYKEAISEIKKGIGDKLIIQCTSESVGIYSPEQQIELMSKLSPEAISIAIREFIPSPSYEKTASKFFYDTVNKGIYPQYILYSPEEVDYFSYLRKNKLIPSKKVSILFVLGKKSANYDDKSSWSIPDDLDKFIEKFDEKLKISETIWSVYAFGGNENSCMEKAINCGGNPRIGFENNHFMLDGSIAKSNASLIKQFVDTTKNNNRAIATAHETRLALEDTI